MKNKHFYIYISILTAFLFALCSLSLFADDFVTYEFRNNACYIEGTKYSTLKTENQCYYGALSISDRQNDISFWQSWLREFDNQTQTSFTALAQQVYDVVTTGKADNLFLDSLKQAYKNDNDKTFATVQTYLTDLLNNGSNKNYYTSNDYTTNNNYSITNTTNKYDTVNNQYYEYINNVSYTYNNNNYNYEINNYTYNTYTNEYTFNTTNNYNFTYINNYNNTTIIDNSGTQNLYYKLPDGSNSLNLTEEEALKGYKTSLSVASYSNTYDSADLEFLYHFDNNEYNAAYPKPVNLSISPNSVEYISSGNFNQALVISENVSLTVDKSDLFYSFRINPRIQDKFKLIINGTEIAFRQSQIETTYDYVEWTQKSTSGDNSAFTYVSRTTNHNPSCSSVSGYSGTRLYVNPIGTITMGSSTYTQYEYACLYKSNTNVTTTTTQRTYNIINNKLYLDTGTRYLNYNQWNYISILLDGSVYINGIDTGIDINNSRNLNISIEQDGVSYIDELSGFNVNRSTTSPSIPYDTNLAYVLPSVYNEKHVDEVLEPPIYKGTFGNTLSQFQYNFLFNNQQYFSSEYLIFTDIDMQNQKIVDIVFLDSLTDSFYQNIQTKSGKQIIVNDHSTDTINDTVWFSINDGHSTGPICLYSNNPISIGNNINFAVTSSLSTLNLPNDGVINKIISYLPVINKEVINNQLTIKSNIYVTDWKFGGIRPSSPEYGYVYVYTDDLGYIKSVQQFNGIEWLEVQASLFNYHEQKWLSAYDFNIFMNDWKSVSSKYQTDNSLFNTLFSFLSDKFDTVVNAIKGVSNDTNNNYITNVENTYNINYQNDTNKLINNLKNADNNIDLNSPLYNMNTTDKQNLTSLTDTFDVFITGLNDSGIGFMVLVPIILGLVGLMF